MTSAFRRFLAAMATAPDHAVPESTCKKCRERIRFLGGTWTDGDGMTNCMADTSAVWAPHEPEG